MPDGRPFDFGTEVDFDSLSRLSAPTGSPEDQVREWWPLFCEECGIVSSTKRVPTLLSWAADGDVERFEVALTGKFAAPLYETLIPVSLRACRFASQMSTSIKRSVMTVVLSHFELPWPLPFDVDRIPVSDDEVYIGQLGEGSDGVWDTLGNAHLGVVGKNGGGKSEAVETLLAQFHEKDWLIVVFTPYENDPAFMPFRERGHLVLDGLGESALRRNVEAFKALVGVFEDRSVQRAEAGTKWWGLPPRTDGFGGWRGKKILVVWEESGEFLQPKAADSAEMKAMKALAILFNGKLSAQGRKNRMHGIWINQQPLVERFGGGDALREIGAVLALGFVDHSYHHVLFQTAKGKAPNPAIGEVLLDRGNPAGRGIMTGFAPTGSGLPLQDAVIQVAFADDDGREAILNRRAGRPVAGREGVVDVVESPPVLTADAGVDPEPEPVAEPVVVAVPLPPRAGLPPWLSPSFVAVSCSFGACGVVFAAAVRFLI